MPAQAPMPTMAQANSSHRLECGDEPAGANRTALGKPAGARPPASDRAIDHRRGRVRDDRRRRLLPEPPDYGDPLFGARPRRYLSHRRRVARGGRAFRRQCREYRGFDAGRTDGGRSNDPGGEGPAAQRRGRQRTFRQARLARPDVVHAGRHPPAGARGRTRAHDSDDAHGQGGAGAYRARRRGLLSPRASALIGLRRDPNRRRRRPRDRAGDPSPCRRRGSRNEAR